jgi:hypothetical protein
MGRKLVKNSRILRSVGYMSFELLVKMQPSRKKTKPGDVFVVQPKEGLFFYGKVIRTDVEIVIKYSLNLIYIFKNPIREKVLPNSLDPKELLTPPQIVNNQGWLKGYFLTIGNIPVTTDDLSINFGFKDILLKRFVDVDGKPLGYEPELWTYYGVGSYGSVANAIHKVLDANPDLIS